MAWYYDPHSGGHKIPATEYEPLIAAVRRYEQTCSWHQKFSIQLRFKGKFCYFDSVEMATGDIFPLGRLRYLLNNQWSLAFFTYSNERYEPCLFTNGKSCGSITEAIDVCSVYLF